MPSFDALVCFSWQTGPFWRWRKHYFSLDLSPSSQLACLNCGYQSCYPTNFDEIFTIVKLILSSLRIFYRAFEFVKISFWKWASAMGTWPKKELCLQKSTNTCSWIALLLDGLLQWEWSYFEDANTVFKLAWIN